MTVFDKIQAATQHGLFRTLLLSLVVLAIPITGTFVIPVQWSDYEALLWLLALVPAFLLAYHKGWKGVATSLAFGMAVLSITYAVAQVLGRHVPDLLFGVVTLYILFALMTGWLAQRLQRDVSREHIGGAAFTDAATGLPNRQHAELNLEIEFNAAQRGRPLTVVALGLDHFKNFTTRHGVIVADDVMRVLGVVLKKTTRRLNLSARYSQDEFLCVLGGTDEDGALVFMSRFHANLAAASAQVVLPTISAGVASFRPGMTSWTGLVSSAHDALNRAKKDGPGRVRVHGRPMNVPVELPKTVAAKEERARPIMPEGRGAGRKALVVVDESPVRALLARYLTDHGFKVAQVSNVVDGVQCLSIEYDLLVTDISLTEGLGAELVRAAKLRWPSIPVLGLAQVGESTAAIESLNAGVDRYIEKPLDLPKLRQHITELLTRHDRMIASVLENRQLSLEVQAEKAEAVNALRRSEEEYRSVVESLLDIIFRLDENGVFTFLNWAWSGITQYSLDDSLGRPLSEFVHPIDRPQVEGDLGALLAGRLEEARGEVRIVTRDGSERWVELRARRIFGSNGAVGGATGTLDDITRRKQAENQLRRTEAASRAILAALPDYVFGLSRAGVFVSYEGSEGVRSAPIGLPLEEEFPAEIARLYRSALERLFDTRDVQVLEYKVEKGGVTDEFEARLAIIGEDEAVVIVRNVSDRKRLEDQLRQSQKLEAIGRLAGGLAHDFNNLLTVVQGNALLLIEEFGDNAPAREFAMQINSAADRGADLVRQLLAFGRKQVMQPRVMNLNAVVASVHGLLPHLLGEDVALQLRLADDLGLVRADPGQIEHVLVNLAAFIKPRLPNGGTVQVMTSNVTAHQDYDPEIVNLPSVALVLLTVTDDGPPVDEQTRSHVFEPFVGAVGTTQAGLGLATVYGIVTQSGGTILLDHAPDGGARFRIFLPRIEAN